MSRTRPFFQFDPGWLYLVAGLTICGAGILIPATDGLRRTEAQVADMRAAERHLRDRVSAYEAFNDAVDRADPDLVRRLAAAQLNLMPAGDVPVFLCTASPATVTNWIEERVPPPAPRGAHAVHAPPTMLRRLAGGRYRLWFLGAGVFCVFLGLIIGSPTTPSAVATCEDDADEPDDGDASRWDDPGQLALFDTDDTAAVEEAVEDAAHDAPVSRIDDDDDVDDDDEVDDDEVDEDDEVDDDEEVIDDDDDVEYEEDDEEGDEDEEEDADEDEDADEEKPSDTAADTEEDPSAEDESEDDEEYEYEYVDEDGNPIDPDEIEEYEVEDEDDGRDAAA